MADRRTREVALKKMLAQSFAEMPKDQKGKRPNLPWRRKK